MKEICGNIIKTTKERVNVNLENLCGKGASKFSPPKGLVFYFLLFPFLLYLQLQLYLILPLSKIIVYLFTASFSYSVRWLCDGKMVT